MRGIDLSRKFFTEVIEPLMQKSFLSINYSAALIGPGSEVLGYDTDMSRDHDWGPRVLLFLKEREQGVSADIRSKINQEVPDSFYGFSVDPRMTIITTIPQFIKSRLAFDIHQKLDSFDWLTFPSQSLLEIISGEVFFDYDGQLAEVRTTFQYYPRDIWLYLMSSAWQRIGQEEHLMPRAGFVGDDLGSAIISSRIVRDMMNLCFLMERKYAPYPKWFGTAFKHLTCAEELAPYLIEAQTASVWKEREHALNQAYIRVARKHNDLKITEPIPDEASHFFDRPFKVMQAGAIASLIAEQIGNEDIRRLADKRRIGNIDLITDNTDFRTINNREEGEKARLILKTLFKP